jgi:D-alanyl-lipoteichoic acid acyltransferase DltB (MBOAT superfamily)
LVAGPIERSTNLLRQFYEKHRFDGERAIRGIQLMLWGFFLKLVVADNLAYYVNLVYNDIDGKPGGEIFVASILFCFQLYGDFAGYSYIAIGAAKVMGFKLMDNFVRPYFFSASVQEFWKRNHISLTTWFMDYIYYPMVGSSINLYWWCFCIFFTFFLSGFWHGANWTFVLWGFGHGLLSSFEDLGVIPVKRLNASRAGRIFSKIYTLFAVMLLFVIFRADSIPDAFSLIRGRERDRFRRYDFNGDLF